jgi:hypothetical protein
MRPRNRSIYLIERKVTSTRLRADRCHLNTCQTVPREDLEARIEHMESDVAGKLAEFVFNPDEVGSSNWVDQKPRKVRAPRTVS